MGKSASVCPNCDAPANATDTATRTEKWPQPGGEVYVLAACSFVFSTILIHGGSTHKGMHLFGGINCLQLSLDHGFISLKWASLQITISEHWNCLNRDIIEAIQCSIWHNLIFCKPAPLSFVGDESDEIQTDEEPGDHEKSDDNVEEEGWDDLFRDEDDDSSDSDIEMW